MNWKELDRIKIVGESFESGRVPYEMEQISLNERKFKTGISL